MLAGQRRSRERPTVRPMVARAGVTALAVAALCHYMTFPARADDPPGQRLYVQDRL